MLKSLVLVAKWLGALVAAAVLFLVIVANFGAAESRWECSGQVQRQVEGGLPTTTAATLYAKVETYRWFLFGRTTMR
jgi:hypothetical protein